MLLCFVLMLLTSLTDRGEFRHRATSLTPLSWDLKAQQSWCSLEDTLRSLSSKQNCLAPTSAEGSALPQATVRSSGTLRFFAFLSTRRHFPRSSSISSHQEAEPLDPARSVGAADLLDPPLTLSVCVLLCVKCLSLIVTVPVN